MLYAFPTTYVDNSGYLDSNYIFVRVGRDEKKLGDGVQYKWQRVEKWFWGFYLPKGKPFFDFEAMFTKV